MAGLHRTGTSLLTQIVGAHPDISAIKGSTAPENEGCYLQGAIPHTACHGVPGAYAIDPAQHHTERSPFNTLETRDRMLADWRPWFAPDARWWLEKSPVNLTRMRLYQQLFPMAQFIVILRHPQIMARALAKWSDRTEAELVNYALKAYDLALADAAFLHAVLFLRYEDLVAEPDRVRRKLFAFLSVSDADPNIEIRDGNAEYSEVGECDSNSAQRWAEWGYAPSGRTEPCAMPLSHPLRHVRDAVLDI